jgi:hypothetical protein
LKRRGCAPPAATTPRFLGLFQWQGERINLVFIVLIA